MPFSFGFKGSFFELGKFFNRLDRFVAVRNNSLDVTGRLLLLNSITLTPDAEKGFPMLSADVSANAYLLPATEGLTAGATADRSVRHGDSRRDRHPGAERPRHDHDRNDLWSHPMSVINDTWRFLVQRRLWPVAILLIAAAVAVPMLLSEEPAAPAPAPAVAVKSDKEAVLATEPIVAQAGDGDRSGRRQVLGSRKDPFKPQVTPTPTPKPETAKAVDTRGCRLDRQGHR